MGTDKSKIYVNDPSFFGMQAKGELTESEKVAFKMHLKCCRTQIPYHGTGVPLPGELGLIA